MAKAYSYSRFSSRAQAEGDSLRRQLAAAYAYAEAHGHDLDISIQDRGVSAFTGANRAKGALRSFLDRVETGEIEQGSYLLIDSMDRLSRETVTEATYQLLGIALAGVNVVTLNDGRVFDRHADMADMMFALMEIDRSHKESAEKGRKVAQAHAESKRRAREEGRVWHRSGPTWLAFNDTTRRFDPIPEKVAVVRQIFDLIEGGLGTTAIAIRLNAHKVPTPRNGTGGWHHSAVLEIAKNRAVIGEYQPKLAKGGNRASRRPADGEAIERYYGEPVVPVDQFHRVQAIIKGRSPQRGRGANAREFNNLLIGLCVCNACGGTVGMHVGARHPKWKRTSVLRCGNAGRGLCPSNRRFPYEPLERAILQHVREFVPPSERRPNDLSSKLAAAEAQKAEIEVKVEHLLALLEDGDDRLMSRYKQRLSELAVIDAQIGALKAECEERGAAIPFANRQQALVRLAAKLATAEGNELYDLRAAISAGLKNVVDWIEFYGRPDETGCGDVVVREDYVMVRMVGDERAYMISEDSIIVSEPENGVSERIWLDGASDAQRLNSGEWASAGIT